MSVQININEISDDDNEKNSNCIDTQLNENSEVNGVLVQNMEIVNLVETDEVSENAVILHPEINGKIQKQPNQLPNPFTAIDLKKKNSYLDISSISLHRKVWKDEFFLQEYGKILMESFSINHKPSGAQANVENFFSFLMYDWFDPEPGQTYAMVKKYQLFGEANPEKNMFKVLFDVIDDQKYKIYRHVVLRLLYQYLYELGKESCLKECFIEMNQLIELLSCVRDQELKLRSIKVVAVFWLISNKEELGNFAEVTKKCLTIDEVFDEAEKATREELEAAVKTSQFLNLCFQLKTEKTSSLNFQEEFDKYVDDSKRYYGDHMPEAISHNIQLLSFLAQKEAISTTFSHIARKCRYSKETTMLTVFDRAGIITGFKVHKFDSPQMEKLFYKFFEKSEKVRSEKLKSFVESFKNRELSISKKDIYRFLFGRILNTELEVQDDSLFEKTLKTPGSGDLIRLLWSIVDLDTRNALPGVKNCNGKYLLEYAIESKDENNLLAFLSPTVDEMSLVVPKVHLKFLNRQLSKRNKTGESLFDHFMDICKASQQIHQKDKNAVNAIFEGNGDGNTLCFDFYKVVLSLLEDGHSIQDIRHDVPIDKLLEWAKGPVEPKESILETGKNLCSLFIGSVKRQTSEIVDESEFKDIREEIDLLIGTIVAFWSKSDPNYASYKEKLLKDCQFKSFFVILLSIIKNDGIDKFSLKFVEKFDRIESVFVKRYGRTLEDKRTRKYFLWLILLAAILNDREDIIEFILKSEPVQNLNFYFPPNMRKNKTTSFFARKMLENGYAIGSDEFPMEWIAVEEFEDFLNSRLSYKMKDKIEVDRRFLTHFHTPEHPVETEAEVKWEDTKCIESILGDLSLKEFITHPTVATCNDLKMHGLRSVYWGNFWFFALLIALPFGLLVMLNFGDSDPNTVATLGMVCICSIVILISREFFQLQVIEDSFRDYIKQSSNILEVCLILVATVTLTFILSVIFLGDYMQDHLENYFGSYVMLTKFLSVTLMLLFTIDLLATLQNAAMPFYFILLQRVAVTFIKFLGTFLVFLIAFTISFMVFFGVDGGVSENPINEAITNVTITNGTKEEKDEKRDDVFDNFVLFPKAFMKIILMLSGEYSIEPIKLTGPELILFFVFVITTFILFNLILGLTIDDVQTLKKEARAMILLQNAESIIGTSSFFLKILDKSYAFKQRHSKSFECIKYFIDLMVTRAEARVTKYLLHKGDNLYINVRTREVTFNIDGKPMTAKKSMFQRICDFISGIFVNRTFVMDIESFEEIKKLADVNQLLRTPEQT